MNSVGGAIGGATAVSPVGKVGGATGVGCEGAIEQEWVHNYMYIHV